MGVDYLTCNNCGENFNDCGDYVSCECGRHWCCDECAEEDGYNEILDEDGDVDWDKTTCKYCREEDFEDEILLDYALQLLGMNREDLIKRYKTTKS